jgi:hypothetical protein
MTLVKGLRRSWSGSTGCPRSLARRRGSRQPAAGCSPAAGDGQPPASPSLRLDRSQRISGRAAHRRAASNIASCMLTSAPLTELAARGLASRTTIIHELSSRPAMSSAV